MKRKLVSAALVACFALAGCGTVTSWFHSSQGQATISALEQYVVSEAQEYFNGTLTLQQLIDSAKAKFASFTAQQILDVILHKLDDPAVAPAAPAHLMTKRPLVIAEKSAIQKTAYDTGYTFIQNGGTADLEPHAKSLLVRRLAYKYRVVASKLKTLAEQSFEDGAKSAGEP
jgi:hypothetical protein